MVALPTPPRGEKEISTHRMQKVAFYMTKFKPSFCIILECKTGTFGMQNAPFQNAKVAVLECKTGSFRMQNAPFWNHIGFLQSRKSIIRSYSTTYISIESHFSFFRFLHSWSLGRNFPEIKAFRCSVAENGQKGPKMRASERFLPLFCQYFLLFESTSN